MLTNQQFGIIDFLLNIVKVDVSTNLNFSDISVSTNIPKNELDSILQQMENERYIDQYIIGVSDSFTIKLKQKGVDAYTAMS